jgi:hypothetical protein
MDKCCVKGCNKDAVKSVYNTNTEGGYLYLCKVHKILTSQNGKLVKVQVFKVGASHLKPLDEAKGN